VEAIVPALHLLQEHDVGVEFGNCFLQSDHPGRAAQ